MIRIEKNEWVLEIYTQGEKTMVESIVTKTAMESGQFSVFQSPEWSEFLRWLLGENRTYIFLLYKNGKIALASWAYAYPLVRDLSWLYFTRGPIFVESEKASESIEQMYRMIPKNFKKQFVWMRLDPLISNLNVKGTSLRVAHASFHPKTTLQLTLAQSEEEILAQMKPKGRYNIRLAEKKGVITELYTASDVEKNIDPVKEFYTIALETTKRDGFSAHSYEYYKQFVKMLGDKAFIILARYENKVIAAGIFTLMEGVCTYYYGASSNEYRQVMAPYLVQWEAIKYAKKQEATLYDFLGINDDGKQAVGAKLDGVTDFKLKFGGKVTSYAGTYEFIVRPLWYLIVRLAKALRSFH